MTWTVHYASQGADVRFTGRVSVQEICDAQREVLRHAYDGPMRFNVFDYSESEDVHLETGDLIRIFDGRKDFLRTRPTHALVLVGHQPVLGDLIRLWEVLASDLPLNTVLVSNREDAQQWLRDHGFLS